MKKTIAIGIAVFLACLVLIPSVSATWCDANYGKKTPIFINNTGGSEQTYYQVELNFTHDSDMNANFSDIRVYNESDCSLVPLWNESAIASSYNKIWFNATNIPASSWTNGTYYLYYDYSTASSASNGTNTFKFFDDFNGDLSKWSTDVSAGCSVSVSGGELLLDAPTTAGDNLHAFVATNSFTFTTAIVEIRMKSSATYYMHSSVGSGSNCLAGSSNKMIQSGYFFMGYTPASHRIRTTDAACALVEIASGADGGAWTSYTTHKQIICDDASNNIRKYIDDALINQVTDNTYLSNNKKISISQSEYSSRGGLTSVDWVFVRKYASPEPTAQLGGEEEASTYIPPNPITLQNTTGDYYVNYTWSPGSGNVTNNYRVNWNETWYNTTTDEFMQKSVGASGWANITVYAWNSSGSGTLSPGSISDQVQAPEEKPCTTPTISSLTNTTPGMHNVTITWTANQSADNRVKYSKNSDLSNEGWSSWDNDTTSVSIGLSGLDAETPYYYQAWSYNGTNSTCYVTEPTAQPFKTFTTTSSSWCDANYGKKAPILINNTGGSAQTYYQVMLNYTHDSNMNANFSDIRVYNNSDCSLIPLWNESVVDGSWNKIWFNATNIPASSWTNDTYYLYYDYSSASSVSNGGNTFDIYDGFEPFALGNLTGYSYYDLWGEDASSPVLNTTAKDGFSSVFKDGSTYHMYYSWGTILHANSTDGKNWTVDTENNPVLSPTEGWETGGVGVPMVWKENGMWYMLYRGGGTDTKKIGLANSTDGINWTKEATNPVLNGTTGQWDNVALDPWGVIKISSTYYLWYNTINSPRKTGLATSTDLINWTKDENNPIFSGDDFFCPFTIKYGSYYYLLITHHVVGEDFSYIDLYRDTNPTFYSANREYMGRVIQSGSLGHDTPCVLTDDIYRDSFSLTSNQLWTYYAVRYVNDWYTGLSIETDIASALSPRDEGEEELIWEGTNGSVTVVNTPTHQGNRSLKHLSNENFYTTFDSKTTGVVSAWMQRDNASADMNELSIYLYENTTIAAIGDFYDYNFRYWNGTFQNTGVAYAVDTWYLMSLEFNTDTDKFNFVITNESGTEVIRQNDISFGNNVNGINKVTFYSSCGVNISGYIDDFYVRKYASPEPTAQLGGEEEAPIYTPTDPTNLQNTTGNFWVNYTWDADSGNVTDLYNVSNQTEWFNGTTNTYYNESVSASEWVNITVYAWNSSGNGTLSAGSVSDQVQVSAADPTWCDANYGKKAPILINNTGGSEQTYYQVMLNITHDSDMNADFSDIRVYNESDCSLIPLWNESAIASSYNQIWFNATNIPASSWCNNTYYLYYNYSSANSVSDGDDTFEFFDDFIGKWSPYSGNPVLSPEGDEDLTAWGSVWKDGANYHMYYSYDDVSDYHRIGHATSSDGKNWTKDSAHNPVLNASEAWEGTDVWDASVWKEGSTWYMLYTGHRSSCAIGLATATNPEGPWIKEPTNPVMTGAGGWETNVENMHCIKIDSTYYLWYNILGGDRKTGLATSTNLTGWTKNPNNPIFSETGTGWFQPCPFKYGSYYYLLIMKYTSGTDYSDIKLYRDTNPTFYSTDRELVNIVKSCSVSGWDSHDQDTPCVLADNITRDSFPGNEIWTYYAGESGGVWKTGLLIETDIESALEPQEIQMSWTKEEQSGCTIELNSSIKKHGNYSYKIHDGSAAGKPRLSTTDVSKSSGVFGVWMRTTDSTGSASEHFDIYVSEGTTLKLTIGFNDAIKKFHYYNGSFQDTAISYSVDTWYLFNIEFDCATDKFNMVVYDTGMSEVCRVDDISFASVATVLNKIMFTGTNGYLGDGYVDAFRVRKYASPEPTAQLGTEEESPTPDTTFTVSLPVGYTKPVFQPPNSTATNYPPNGQSSSQEFYNVTNTGNVNLDVRMRLNATVSTITLKVDADNDPTGADTITTSLVTVYPNLGQGSSADIWLWSDFDHTPAQTVNRTVYINVSKG